jgi:hypothetical protein
MQQYDEAIEQQEKALDIALQALAQTQEECNNDDRQMRVLMLRVYGQAMLPEAYDSTEVKVLTSQVVDLAEKMYAQDDSMLFDALGTLGVFYYRHGQLDAAEELLGRCLYEQEVALCPNYDDILNYAHGLATVHGMQVRTWV